jgi:hypothetical protein
MGRALKYLFRIAILAAIGIVVYAMVADLPPPTRVVEQDLPMPAPAPPPPPDPAPASAAGPDAAPTPAADNE